MPRGNQQKRENFPKNKHQSTKKSKTDMAENGIEQLNVYLKQIVADNQKLIHEMQLQNENHNKQFITLSNELSSVKCRVSQLEVLTCARSINVIGVPIVAGESTASLLKVLKRICGALKVSISEHDVDDIFRIGNDKNNIKIEFTAKLKRREIIKAARRIKIFGNDVGLETVDRLFFYENLSHQNRILHNEARKLQKEGFVAYVWIDNGRILVRKKEGTKAVLVQRLVDMTKLRNS